jgi:two-component system phosphate regulon response regulator OmpR
MSATGVSATATTAAPTARVVVCDDEPDLRATVAEYLAINGFAVTEVDGGPALRAHVEAEPVDLVVLDLRMPGEDGLSLARHLRETGDTAVVMLTAAGETIDRIVGLEMGADDYLAKPVDLRELLARVRAVLRRRAAAGPALPEAEGAAPPSVAFGRCRLDLDAHRLFGPEGAEIPLTSMEYDLLAAFAQNPNRVLSRDRLLDLAHNRDWEPFDRSIDVRVTRIRKKIEEDPAKPQVIKTVRGAGYIFVPG